MAEILSAVAEVMATLEGEEVLILLFAGLGFGVGAGAFVAKKQIARRWQRDMEHLHRKRPPESPRDRV